MTTTRSRFENSGKTLSGLAAVFCVALLLMSCSQAPGTRSQTGGIASTALFRPPTPQVSTAVPTRETAGESGFQPTPDTACKDALVFIADATIPDGSIVAPDATLDKRWEVENKGNCNWDKNYRVRLVAGPALGAEEEQALFPARSGTRVIIRMVFKAPLEPGTYRSAWQAHNPAGEPFGDPFFIDIIVQ